MISLQFSLYEATAIAEQQQRRQWRLWWRLRQSACAASPLRSVRIPAPTLHLTTILSTEPVQETAGVPFDADLTAGSTLTRPRPAHKQRIDAYSTP